MVVNKSLIWEEARTSCLSQGGDLASVGSEEEDNFINSLGSNFYLGGSDSAQEGTWVWSDGTAWTYVNWGSGAPNNQDNDEHCVIGNWFGRGHWQDGTSDRTGTSTSTSTNISPSTILYEY